MNPTKYFGGEPPPRPCAACGRGRITYDEARQDVETRHRLGWRTNGITRRLFTYIDEEFGWTAGSIPSA
jgi:hypothetical protein